MNLNLSNKLPQQAWLNAVVALAAVYVVYKLSQGLTRVDDGLQTATKPIGGLLSDISLWLNGSHEVEVTDLQIPSHLVDENYRLSDEAIAVYNRIPKHRALLDAALLPDRTIRTEYRYLIYQSQGV